ncbi:hypothetical protein DIPPA_06328 [Diplonema papillatum]|nr:hypothetical protein DIPPA_06328 [Diplonema papillatum]
METREKDMIDNLGFAKGVRLVASKGRKRGAGVKTDLPAQENSKIPRELRPGGERYANARRYSTHTTRHFDHFRMMLITKFFQEQRIVRQLLRRCEKYLGTVIPPGYKDPCTSLILLNPVVLVGTDTTAEQVTLPLMNNPTTPKVLLLDDLKKEIETWITEQRESLLAFTRQQATDVAVRRHRTPEYVRLRQARIRRERFEPWLKGFKWEDGLHEVTSEGGSDGCREDGTDSDREGDDGDAFDAEVMAQLALVSRTSGQKFFLEKIARELRARAAARKQQKCSSAEAATTATVGRQAAARVGSTRSSHRTTTSLARTMSTISSASCSLRGAYSPEVELIDAAPQVSRLLPVIKRRRSRRLEVRIDEGAPALPTLDSRVTTPENTPSEQGSEQSSVGFQQRKAKPPGKRRPAPSPPPADRGSPGPRAAPAARRPFEADTAIMEGQHTAAASRPTPPTTLTEAATPVPPESRAKAASAHRRRKVSCARRKGPKRRFPIATPRKKSRRPPRRAGSPEIAPASPKQSPPSEPAPHPTSPRLQLINTTNFDPSPPLSLPPVSPTPRKRQPPDPASSSRPRKHGEPGPKAPPLADQDHPPAFRHKPLPRAPRAAHGALTLSPYLVLHLHSVQEKLSGIRRGEKLHAILEFQRRACGDLSPSSSKAASSTNRVQVR